MQSQLNLDGRDRIEEFVFADQTVTHTEMRLRLVSDLKATGTVVGTSLQETYFHTLGDGSYTLKDYDYRKDDVDRLVFTDVASDEVTLTRSGEHLNITLANGEVISVQSQLNLDGRDRIEEFVFTDQTVTHTEMRLRLVSDLKATGTVVGTSLQETYFHALGDGSYTLKDYDYRKDDVDRLVFTDVASDEAIFTQNSNNLLMHCQTAR